MVTIPTMRQRTVRSVTRHVMAGLLTEMRVVFSVPGQRMISIIDGLRIISARRHASMTTTPTILPKSAKSVILGVMAATLGLTLVA